MQLNLTLGPNEPLTLGKKRVANSDAVLDFDNETRVETSCSKDIPFLEPPPSVVGLSGNKVGSADNTTESFRLPMLE